MSEESRRLTRLDLGGSQQIHVFTDPINPDVVHVYADHSVPQSTIDARVTSALIRASRPDTAHLRGTPTNRLGANTRLLFDQDFLADAHKAEIMDAIIEAAIMDGGADLAGLRLRDPSTNGLEIAAAEGMSPAGWEYFRTVRPGDPHATAVVMTTHRPVLVDDVARSSIFVGEPSLQVMLDEGCRAVASYPLRAGGRLLGTLAFHFHRPGIQRVASLDAVAQAATGAVAHYLTLPGKIP